MPDFMHAALEQNNLMKAYKSRPAYQQNDYVWWISSPKLESTKQKRLNVMLNELRAGNVYMNMSWHGKSS